MIVPMKKVTLLALASDEDAALTALRGLGVMQVVSAGSAASELSTLLTEELETGRRTLAALDRLEKLHDGIPAKAHHRSGAETLEVGGALLDRRDQLQGEADAVRQRLKNLEVWGEFDRDQVEALRAKGVFVTFCAGSEAELTAARELPGAECKVIDDSGYKIYFVVLSLTEPEAGRLPVVHLSPQDNPPELRKRLAELEEQLSVIDRDLRELLASLGAAKHRIAQLAAEQEFSTVRDALADHGRVVSLSGFVPGPEVEKLRAAAADHGWGLLLTDPEPDEMVPTLVKRSKFSRLIAPLFEFLGIAPGYDEMDVSAGVLVFFTIFYAMIVGDAGYGLIFLAGTIFAALKFRKHPAAALPVKLFGLLSVATIVWGVITGNVFGMGLPSWLEWARVSALTDSLVKDANTQCFCFILAALQLSLGRLWRAVHDGTVRSYGRNIGWTLVLWGNFFLILKLLVYPGAFPAYMFWLFGIGLLLVICCDVDWKNPADIFQFPFNVIGSFTDVLSYIRLFAVGLAGYYIASSFNGMGKSLFDLTPWLLPAGALVILFGHVLNLGLCVMSVMVHGVRLNTLEFSNHVGLRWGGTKFRPFQYSKKLEEN